MDTPLQMVKSRFGSKADLITKLAPLLDRAEGESDADFKGRLLRASNRKLIRLWEREHRLREAFGSREALVDAIMSERARGGKHDVGYRSRLLRWSTGRLLSVHAALKRTAAG